MFIYFNTWTTQASTSLLQLVYNKLIPMQVMHLHPYGILIWFQCHLCLH